MATSELCTTYRSYRQRRTAKPPQPRSSHSAGSGLIVAMRPEPAPNEISSAPRTEIRIHLALEKIQRQSSGVKDDIVELLQCEILAKRLLCFLTKLNDFQLTQHICAGLAGINNVTLNLAGLDAIVDRLLPGPMLCVNTGIDNETACAKQFSVELTEQAFRIVLIPAGLGRQPLGIESPSLAQRRNPAKCPNLPETRQVLVFHFESKLEMMAGNGFVVYERAQTEPCHALVPERDLKSAWPRSVRSRSVVTGCRVRFAETGIGLGNNRSLWCLIKK